MEQLSLRTRIRFQKTIAYRSVLKGYLALEDNPKAAHHLGVMDKYWETQFGKQSMTPRPSPDCSIWEWLKLELESVELYLEAANHSIGLEII